MNVHLTRELEEIVERKVASGLYGSAAEVIRAGLRLLVEEDEWRTEVRRRIAEGVADLRAGRVVDGERALARLDRRLKALEKRAGG